MSARAALERVLDGAARRLLREQLDADTLGPAAGPDHHSLDGGLDGGSALGQGEPIPVLDDVDRERGAEAA